MKRYKKSRLLALILVSIIIAVFLIPRMVFAQNPEWMTFTTANSSLSCNTIWSLAIDTEENIWIGTSNGLVKFDRINWYTYGEPDDRINSIAIDSKGNKWIMLLRKDERGYEAIGGLAKFDGTNWTVYNSENSELPCNLALDVDLDSQDNVWIATLDGLAKFDGTNWTVYNTDNSGLPDNKVLTLATDSQDNVWIGTYGKGLAKFDGTNWIVYNRENSKLPDNYISVLTVDPQNNVWIGTYQQYQYGLIKFDGVNWVFYDRNNTGLANGLGRHPVFDSQGNIWVGTYRGLVKFDGVKWTFYPIDNNVDCPEVMDISRYFLSIDTKGNKWIGTEHGLAVYREGGVILSNDQVAVEEDNSQPLTFTLSQNYPNPFNPTTEISFGLLKDSQVTLTVFNALGQKVATLVDEVRQAGNHQVRWDGTEFPTGIYFYCLETKGFAETRKMLLMK